MGVPAPGDDTSRTVTSHRTSLLFFLPPPEFYFKSRIVHSVKATRKRNGMPGIVRTKKRNDGLYTPHARTQNDSGEETHKCFAARNSSINAHSKPEIARFVQPIARQKQSNVTIPIERFRYLRKRSPCHRNFLIGILESCPRARKPVARNTAENFE